MRLSTVNNLLLAAIILVNLFVIATPLLPAVWFRVQAAGSRQQILSRQIHAGNPVAAAPVVDRPDSLTIPAMLLDQPILEGHDIYAVLNRGVLRWPASSTPDKGGNTVLIGHRFTYSVPKGVFYHLDKLRIGDEIGLIWHNKQYLYTVTTVKVVPPTETAVQDNTPDARLTLFTCTSLLLPKNRLVVIAQPEQAKEPARP